MKSSTSQYRILKRNDWESLEIHLCSDLVKKFKIRFLNFLSPSECNVNHSGGSIVSVIGKVFFVSSILNIDIKNFKENSIYLLRPK